MQLRVARLCLDCEDIHDGQQCPACGSETFAYISRWVPAPERRLRPRSAQPNSDAETDAETYRQLLAPDRTESARARWLKRGAVGLAAVGVIRLIWRRTNAGSTPARDAGSDYERDR